MIDNNIKILRELEAKESFMLIQSVNGVRMNFGFIKGEKIPQVQTPIGAKRKLLYILKNGHVIFLNDSLIGKYIII